MSSQILSSHRISVVPLSLTAHLRPCLAQDLACFSISRSSIALKSSQNCSMNSVLRSLDICTPVIAPLPAVLRQASIHAASTAIAHILTPLEDAGERYSTAVRTPYFCPLTVLGLSILSNLLGNSLNHLVNFGLACICSTISAGTLDRS